MSQALEKVFREEYGRIIATLIRISGSFDLAESVYRVVSRLPRHELCDDPGI